MSSGMLRRDITCRFIIIIIINSSARLSPEVAVFNMMATTTLTHRSETLLYQPTCTLEVCVGMQMAEIPQQIRGNRNRRCWNTAGAEIADVGIPRRRFGNFSDPHSQTHRQTQPTYQLQYWIERAAKNLFQKSKMADHQYIRQIHSASPGDIVIFF